MISSCLIFLMERMMHNYGAAESEGRRLFDRTGIKVMKTRLVPVPASHGGTRTKGATRLKAHQEDAAAIFSSSMVLAPGPTLGAGWGLEVSGPAAGLPLLAPDLPWPPG
jgi:hypothetical protein